MVIGWAIFHDVYTLRETYNGAAPYFPSEAKKFPTTLDTLKSTQLPEIKSNPDTIHNSVLTLS